VVGAERLKFIIAKRPNTRNESSMREQTPAFATLAREG
jgi:hypothetical protein